MSGDRWDRLKRLVQEALELEPDERPAFLARECAGDTVLLQDAQSLIAGNEAAAPTFLEAPRLDGSEPVAAGSAGAPVRLGEFELLEEIGRGGVGVVYRARQAGLDRWVAVKVLEVGLATSEQAIQRFEREARAVAKLHHEGIVPIYAVGAEGVNHWFAMEFVTGGDLAQELQRQRLGRAAKLPLLGASGHARSVARRMSNVARALQAAHDVGVVHRDVKPQNLLIDEEGSLRLADFGLAKDEALGSLSLSGELLGTPYYMSPEQARARRDGIDHRTDVYSAGAVLYEMLTLRRPFEGDTVQEVLADIAERDPAPIRRFNSSVPRDLELICAKAMAKSAEDRYASAGEFADDLDRLLNLEAVHAQAPSLLARVRRRLVRRRRLLASLAAVVLALLVGFALARSSVRGRADQRLAQELRASLELPSWDVREGDLAVLRGRLEDRQGPEPTPTSELGSAEVLWRARLATHADGLIERGTELRRRGLGRVLTSGGALTPREPRDLLLGLGLLQRALLIAPNAPGLDVLADEQSALPSLSLRLDPQTIAEAGTDKFEAALVLFDPVRGGGPERMPLLAADGTPQRVPPGQFRIRVEVPGFGAAELTRRLEWGDELDLVVRVLPASRVRVGMVRIAAESMTPRPGPDAGGRGSGPGCFVQVDQLDVGDFWIDEAEVSNAEYLEFVFATGHNAPLLWKELGFESSFDDLDLGEGRERFGQLPVTTMAWASAVAYAEWRGKRLPTHRELEYVLRGSAGSFYPPQTLDARTDDLATSFYAANTDGEPIPRTVDFLRILEGYVDNVLPVREPGHRQPPFDLYHAFGNVSELTESPPIVLREDRVDALSEYALALGSSWASRVNKANLASHELVSTSATHYASSNIGFRCAMSDS